MTKRSYGDGAITPRGPDTWRLRYRVGGRRLTKTVQGTRVEAQRELRRLLKAGDDGEHVAPNRLTLSKWAEDWLLLLARGETNARRRGLVSVRTRERYGELLRVYVLPTLGTRRLQQLTATEIDKLYMQLEQRLSVTSVRHVHVALRACLAVAVRKGYLAKNPCDAADVPRPQEPDVGQALEAADLKRVLDGFKGRVLYPIVCAAAFTGARLSEVLALQWRDLDPVAKTLRIERAIEHTTTHGLFLKEPKSKRGNRTIVIEDSLMTVLLAERERQLRFVAGVPATASVDLSLIKLPSDALMFPSPAIVGGTVDLTRLRHPKSVTKEIRARFRELGFAKLRFHDLRGAHGTALLDAGMPVHTVAERLGHDPAVLLKAYAKRTKKADTATAAALARLAKEVL
jgi:integrase